MKRSVATYGCVGALVLGFAALAPAQSSRERGDYPQSYFRRPEPSVLRANMMQAKLQDDLPNMNLPAMGLTSCAGGDAGGYPCWNVDLESFLPLDSMGGGGGNDIWGWTDLASGREYALFARTTGTSFIDVSDPSNPIYLGDLPTHTVESGWRDVKVYQDHAFIVSEAENHGMQVFDLRQLRSVPSPPVTFVNTAHYADFGSAHNIVIDEATGFAFGVGSKTCNGGLHIVDIRQPTTPSFAGCFDADGYTHDAQCVVYAGPDTAYAGRELCFAYNEDTLTIVDVTDKAAPIEISRTNYAQRGYTHQGWLTPDHRFVVMDDELDELRRGVNTSTHIWDLSELARPLHLGRFQHATRTIDHNQYVVGNLVYQANYRRGLRILELCCGVREVGYFDIFPDNDNARFSGAWSVYPYFASGIVIISGMEQGLFVVRPDVPVNPTCDDLASTTPAGGVGNELLAYRDGDDAVLVVGQAPVTDGGFNFYRSGAKWREGNPLGGVPTTTASTHTDVGVAWNGATYFYRTRGVSGCGLVGP